MRGTSALLEVLARRWRSIQLWLKRRTQEGHVVFRKQRRDGLWVSRTRSRKGSQLLIKLVPAAGRVDHDDLGGIVSQVEKSMRDLRGKISKASFLQVEDFVANPNLE